MRRIQKKIALLLSAFMVSSVAPQTILAEDLGSGNEIAAEYQVPEENTQEASWDLYDETELPAEEDAISTESVDLLTSGAEEELSSEDLEEVVAATEMDGAVVVNEEMAALLNEGEVESASGGWINPLYSFRYAEGVPQVRSGIPQVGAGSYMSDYGQIVSAYRTTLVNRQEDTRLLILLNRSYLSSSSVNSYLDQLTDDVFAETENAYEGDYLYCNTGGIGWNASWSHTGNNYYLTVDLNTDCYTTASQERSVNSRVSSLKSRFNRYSNQFERVCAIYDYVCSNIDYVSDERLYDDSDTLKYTAYDGLINGECVCQGYAALLYRLFRECGIPSRVIGEDTICHAWNIVKVGTNYYYVDATWDADLSDYANPNKLEYPYFLRGSSDFDQTRTVNMTRKGWTYSYQVSNSNHYVSRSYINSNTNRVSDYPIARYHYTTSTAMSYTKLYRLYNKYSGEHFYTASEEERDQLVTKGWQYEPKQGWNIPTSGVGAEPVYRLYNPKKGYEEHHYTKDAHEMNVLISNGWRYEGVAFYSDPKRGVPVYRLFNSRLNSAASHHYTADYNEFRTLVNSGQGWRSEGICWYGVKG